MTRTTFGPAKFPTLPPAEQARIRAVLANGQIAAAWGGSEPVFFFGGPLAPPWEPPEGWDGWILNDDVAGCVCVTFAPDANVAYDDPTRLVTVTAIAYAGHYGEDGTPADMAVFPFTRTVPRCKVFGGPYAEYGTTLQYQRPTVTTKRWDDGFGMLDFTDVAPEWKV